MCLQQQYPDPGVLKRYSCVYDARYRWLYVNPFAGLEYWAVRFPEGFEPPAPRTPDRTSGLEDWYLIELEGSVTEVGEFGSPEFPLTRLLAVQRIVHMEKIRNEMGI